MSRNGKVIVAMSGGVDSSVAAALLKEQGYACVGLFMRVGARPGAPSRDGDSAGLERPGERPARLKHGCCSVSDALDARAVAAKLGIPFYALNFEPDFEQIIGYFVDEYARARTPNPCARCNTELKFGKLLRYAELTGAEFVATGHYARLLWDDGPPRLARAANLAKDQSYVLFGIRRGDLARCLFPLGGVPDKAAVRAMAAELGLAIHDKPDSQEICFVPDNDYRQLLRERRPETQQPGEIRDSSGRVLGTHAGVANYTIGQRHGLGIAAGRPVYVTKRDPASNTLTVGAAEDLLADGLVAEDVNWLVDPPPAEVAQLAWVKIRHTHRPAAGTIRVRAAAAGGPPQPVVEVRFGQPQPAVAPGQAAVFYDEAGVVLGGGWIA